MRKNFHENYQHGDVEMPSERGTGLVFAGVAVIAGLIFFYLSDYTNYIALALGFVVALIFAFLAMTMPHTLKTLNLYWFKFSLLLYKIINPIVMGLMFLIAIVPAGLLMRIWYDPLRAKKPQNAKTYWLEKNEDSIPKSMKNQF